MANYIIIGGDNMEYGPVDERDVRQWIAEGRLNAESRVKAESDAEFRALAQFPEFAEALKPATAAPGVIAPAAVSPPATPESFLDRDYELDISGCISRAWEVYKENFGTLFGSFLIMILVQVGCAVALNVVTMPFSRALLEMPIGVRIGYGVLSSVVLNLVMGPMIGGLFLVYLKVVRGEDTGVGEVFAGFQRAYMHLFLGALVVSLVATVCMLPFQFVWQSKVGPLLVQMQHMQNDPAGIQKLFPQMISSSMSSLPVLFVCLIPVTFFTVCWQFTLPLIIDKQMAFGDAMRTSWHMVMKHWWPVFGVIVLAGLLSLLGVFGCCVGVLFTAPIGLAALMVAYETIFGAQKA
jgi:hypothetical protein